MRIIDAFRISMLMIKKELKVNPDKQYKRPSGETIQLKEVLDCYTRLSGLLYPDLTDEDIVKVIRCKHCIHYKKVKGEKFNTVKRICALTGEVRKDSGFCDRGCEK